MSEQQNSGRPGAAVAVLVDHLDGAVRPTALELLTLARGLDRQVHAVWVGSEGGAEAPAAELAAHGAHVVHEVEVAGADARLTASVVDALQAVLTAVGDVGLLLVPSTFEGREVAARLAVRTGAGVVTGASGVAVEDGRWTARKTVLAGGWDTACALTGPLAVVALASHAVQAVAQEAAAPSLVRHTAQASAAARAVTVVSRTRRPTSERPPLAEAEVVVVGGRGVEGDFSGVEELADVLGGAVGATRVATDEGWIGHEAQVGQTGVTISPRLYIGVGVSGAVHHKGGMAASATVVAVNNDPDAPVFEFADYGIVGDLTEVLPALTAELRRRRG
ncbi:electron transfer flavoprotein subunit alpha/FixB family protein [Kineococcus sp. LSe6-4]|uniref:Electron transfer flavoprotein subunit alpha/FixB family protein n=1 Tax=Kineococcus halophytocola TaxID=3234027 RepID=A0ABV4H089_9ACTN